VRQYPAIDGHCDSIMAAFDDLAAAAELERRGYPEGDVALVMGGNWRRVFAAVTG